MGSAEIFNDGFSERPSTPEQRLLVALLRRAVLDYLSTDRELASEAAGWFKFAPYQGSEAELYSFGWVCDQLSIPSEEFFRNLQKMQQGGMNIQEN